jgi:predicted methyltransferase
MTSMRQGLLTACVLLGIVAPATPSRAQSEQLRDSWQRVNDLFAAAGVRAGARIADVGSGDGFLTIRLAPAVGPAGKVYAVDIDAKVIDRLRQRLATAAITNVTVTLGAEDDPRLPIGTLDGALIVNAYHEMPSGIALLRHLHEALKPGGHLVLCEPTPRTPNQSRSTQMNDHVLDPDLIVEDLRTAGFHVLERQDRFAANLGGSNFGFVVAARP